MHTDINPRHKGMLVRHSLGDRQFNIGRKLSPLEIQSTTECTFVFYRGVVYVMPPTKYNPIKNRTVKIQRNWWYDRDQNGNFFGERKKSVKVENYVSMEELHLAILRETNLGNFQYAETAYRCKDLFNEHLPECEFELCFHEEHVRSCNVQFNERWYSISLTRSGDIKVFSGNKRVFVALTPEAVLSWFIALKLGRPTKGCNENTLWTANSHSPEFTKPLRDLDTDHLYNISNWMATRLCMDASAYGVFYTADTIVAVNKLLCERMQIREPINGNIW